MKVCIDYTITKNSHNKATLSQARFHPTHFNPEERGKCAFKMATQLNSTQCQNPKTHSLTVSHYETLNYMKVCVCEVL